MSHRNWMENEWAREHKKELPKYAYHTHIYSISEIARNVEKDEERMKRTEKKNRNHFTVVNTNLVPWGTIVADFVYLARLHFVTMYYRGRTEPVKHIAHIFEIVSHPFTWLQLRIIFKRNSKRAPQYTHTLQVSKRDKKNKVNLIWYNNNHNFIVRRLFLAATIFRPLWITMRFSVGFVLTTSIFLFAFSFITW